MRRIDVQFFPIIFFTPRAQRQLQCSAAESVKLLWSSKQLKCHFLQDFCQAHIKCNRTGSYMTQALKSTIYNMAHSYKHFLSHSHTPMEASEGNLGFSILPKDTWACRLKIKPTIFWLVDGLLQLLNYNNQNKLFFTIQKKKKLQFINVLNQWNPCDCSKHINTWCLCVMPVGFRWHN